LPERLPKRDNNLPQLPKRAKTCCQKGFGATKSSWQAKLLLATFLALGISYFWQFWQPPAHVIYQEFWRVI